VLKEKSNTPYYHVRILALLAVPFVLFIGNACPGFVKGFQMRL
jgi:hypothetical protein